jgi:hypothetical protein
VIYALNPKNYTKIYKLYNAKQKNLKKHKKKFRNQNFKLLNYKDILTKKNLTLKKKSNKFCKNQKYICLLLLCDLSKLVFSTLFENNIE